MEDKAIFNGEDLTIVPVWAQGVRNCLKSSGQPVMMMSVRACILELLMKAC